MGLVTDSPCDDCNGSPCSVCVGIINGNCRECRDGLRWQDRCNYGFQNLQRGKPDNGNVACARLFNNGQWRNQGWCSKYPYICKKIGMSFVRKTSS